MLLEARKTPVLDRLYAGYGRRLLRRAFARIRVGGLAWPETDGPTIALVNHSAWWDPIVALHLSHDLFRRDGYGLMRGEQLVRYPFFRRVGCFGATTDGLGDARAVAAHAARVLAEGRRRTLWLFPQGALLPARAPLAFRSGAARFASAAPHAPVVPVALRYEHRTEQRPELWVRVGAPVAAAAGDGARRSLPDLTRHLEAALRAELARLDADLAHPDAAGYATSLDGRGSLSTLYDRTFGRWGGRAREPGAGKPIADRPSPIAGQLTPDA